MFNIEQFRKELIHPALDKLGLWSKEATELLVLTCAQETLGGTFIKQIEGPALGIYQMEPKTHEALWASYLPRRADLAYKLLSSVYISSKPPIEYVKYNLLYATMIARIFYYQFPEALPSHEDVKGLAQYYKKYWNTEQGSATVEQAIANYNKFTGIKPAKK